MVVLFGKKEKIAKVMGITLRIGKNSGCSMRKLVLC